jgi:thiamine transport system permease protein
LYRRRWRGSRTIAAALTAPFVLPTMVVALAFLTLQRDLVPALGARHGLSAIIGALAFFNVAVVLRTVGPALDGMDERLVAAARTLGASRFAAARRVVWPAVRRSVGGATAITFLFCSTSFAIVLVLGGTRIQTLETAAYIELTSFLDLRSAALIALVQACLVASVAAGVGWLSRPGRYAVTHAAPLRPSAGRRDVAAIGLALTPALFLTLIPLGTLVAGSLRGAHGPSLDAYRTLFGLSEGGAGIAGSVVASLWIALVAAALSLVVGVLAVTAAAVHPGARWVRALTVGPLAVSSVVVGVGLLIALAVPLRSWGSTGTYMLLIAAQALIATPLVVRVLAPVLEGIDPRQSAAAATLGASPTRTVVRVVVPRMRAALASAAGLAFAVAVGEFGASVFLARPGTPTLPTAIMRLLSRPGAENVATASASAVVLAAIAGGAMMLAEGTRRQRR